MQRRIVYVVTGLNYGGAEAQVVALATTFKRRGWDVRLVSLLPLSGFARELDSAGIPPISLGMRKGIPDPRAMVRLALLLRRWQPSIVHSHMVHANLLARLARLLHWTPILISTAHSLSEGGRWRECAYRLTDPLADLTTNVSRAAVDRYIQVGAVPREKIVCMPNGVDVSRFRPDPSMRHKGRADLGIRDSFVWLAVGRLVEAKDYPNMLRAFALALQRCNDGLLLIAGSGPLEGQLRALTCQLGIEPNVRFLGMRRDIPELMNSADAYVMSSAWEGMPMALLEAGACCMPIVATAVGGNTDIVQDGEGGYLVTAGNHCALSEAMVRMLSYLQRNETAWANRTGPGYLPTIV